MTPFRVGLDGGGTGCRARAYGPGGERLVEAAGDPANLLIGDGAGPHAAILSTVEAVLAAAGASGEEMAAAPVGLGLAGATPAALARLRARPWPFGDARVVTDGHAAALGAHGGEDGAVVILGTGAAACVALRGRAREIGGWGLAVDDAGSGAWIGRRLLRAALRRHDGEPALAALSEAVLARWSGDTAAAVDWAAMARPGDFGVLAPLAFELGSMGEPAAEDLLRAAAGEGARLVRLCRVAGAPRVALAGSVAVRLATRIAADLAPEDAAVLTPAQGDAADGALMALEKGLGARLG